MKWKAIRKMLDACAEGRTHRDGVHHRSIYYDGLTGYLPLGEHGRRQNPEIEVGHIRAMARNLGIYDCARREIEQLR